MLLRVVYKILRVVFVILVSCGHAISHVVLLGQEIPPAVSPSGTYLAKHHEIITNVPDRDTAGGIRNLILHIVFFFPLQDNAWPVAVKDLLFRAYFHTVLDQKRQEQEEKSQRRVAAENKAAEAKASKEAEQQQQPTSSPSRAKRSRADSDDEEH